MSKTTFSTSIHLAMHEEILKRCCSGVKRKERKDELGGEVSGFKISRRMEWMMKFKTRKFLPFRFASHCSRSTKSWRIWKRWDEIGRQRLSWLVSCFYGKVFSLRQAWHVLILHIQCSKCVKKVGERRQVEKATGRICIHTGYISFYVQISLLSVRIFNTGLQGWYEVKVVSTIYLSPDTATYLAGWVILGSLNNFKHLLWL